LTAAFSDLPLIEPLLRAVAEQGYTTPTPIQLQGIPLVLDGCDVLGCAQTGTGKTAAFALPILQHLMQHPAPRNSATGKRPVRVLVLSPTRELAAQIEDSFEAYGRHTDVRCTVVYGGVNQASQTRALEKGVDVLVATPGRLLDLMEQGYVRLGDVEILVLDEADRMLDMGFIVDVRRIVRTVPKDRQTLFFSATMPNEILTLARDILHEPAHVEVTPVASTSDHVEQFVYFVEKHRKSSLLAHLLDDDDVERALVFARTKRGADRIVQQLVRSGVRADVIHGDKSQGQRERVLAAFKAGKVRVLVATDVAARGIDIDDITHVFNYDLPDEADNYVHRIGRTARAGAGGTAIAFCAHEEFPWLADIEAVIRRQIVAVMDHPWPSPYKAPPSRFPPPPPVVRSERSPRPVARLSRGGLDLHTAGIDEAIASVSARSVWTPAHPTLEGLSARAPSVIHGF